MDKKLIFVLFVNFAVHAASKSLERDVGISKSDVKIRVGEDNFIYEVRGVTYSEYRISVSGDYYDDKNNRCGHVYLYLVGEPDIYTFYDEYDPQRNELHVRAKNYWGYEFFYRISVPREVHAHNDLYGERYNDTALIVRAPSYSGRRCF